MTYNPFATELAQFDQEWAELPSKPSFDRLPDGRYQARIAEVTIERSKSSGRLQLKWEFVIATGPHQNRRTWMYQGLDHADSLPYAKAALAVAGLSIDKLSQLPDQLHRLRDGLVEIRLRTKGDYQNTYIEKNLDSGYTPDNNDDFPEDDVPF